MTEPQWPFTITNIPANKYQGLIGSIILDNAIIPDVVRYIKPDDFHEERYRLVYETILKLWKDDKRVNVLLIFEKIKADGKLNKIADTESVAHFFVGENVENMATAKDYKDFAEYIILDSKRRKLSMLGTEIVSDTGSTKEVDEIIAETDEKLMALRSKPDQGGSMAGELIPGFQRDIDDYEEGKVGFKTGFIDVDNAINGLMPGNLYLLAARPQMGKTALALNIADYIANQGKTVAFFSVEMSDREIMERLVCSRARVDNYLLRKGKLIDLDHEKIVKTTDIIKGLPLVVFSKQRSVIEIKAESQILKRIQDLSLIVVDYIQLLNAPQSENRTQEIAAISKGLKQISVDMDIPVLALSQLSRACEMRAGDKKPRLVDLRDSGNLEQDADVVMFIWRPVIYESRDSIKQNPYWKETEIHINNYAELLIRKVRMGGKCGDISLLFYPEFTRFENLEKRRSNHETKHRY